MKEIAVPVHDSHEVRFRLTRLRPPDFEVRLRRSRGVNEVAEDLRRRHVRGLSSAMTGDQWEGEVRRGDVRVDQPAIRHVTPPF